MSIRVFLLSQDRFWLRALSRAQLGEITMETASLVLDVRGRLENLPPSHPQALVIVDASSNCDLSSVIEQLVKNEWKNVIVVAADPTSKEALLVLRDNPTYDYWIKTYDPDNIRVKLESYLHEMNLDSEI